MRFYSTRNRGLVVDLKTAVMQSLPADRGLYMPVEIPRLPQLFFDSLEGRNITDIGLEMARPYLSEDFEEDVIQEIIHRAIDFPAPLVELEEGLDILELWHGPSMAFKDYGARFMAQVMSRLVEGEDRPLTILVATSGDTGGAVAAGFLGVENVEVIILYPSGKVSPIQEKQLTTLGQNISAIEVDGTFDDCQALVKEAFLDHELSERFMLSSANSINIARLLPQSFYYVDAYRQMQSEIAPTFIVPSGNFGNLTAGLLAQRMGLPVRHFVAATNVNDTVPRYLAEGNYQARPSEATISNAMDVGDPSNFQRMADLYGGVHELMVEDVIGYSFDDEVTRAKVKDIHARTGYVMDPHGAVGYAAWEIYKERFPDAQGVLLETAHPAKFLPVMEPLVGEFPVPDRLSALMGIEKVTTSLSSGFEEFKEYLMSRS